MCSVVCVVDHILQEFNTLHLTRFRTCKIATPPETKTPVKTTFRDGVMVSLQFLRPCPSPSLPITTQFFMHVHAVRHLSLPCVRSCVLRELKRIKRIIDGYVVFVLSILWVALVDLSTVDHSVSNAISFQKIRRIDSEWLPLFRGRNCSFRDIRGLRKSQISNLIFYFRFSFFIYYKILQLFSTIKYTVNLLQYE